MISQVKKLLNKNEVVEVTESYEALIAAMNSKQGQIRELEELISWHEETNTQLGNLAPYREELRSLRGY